MKIGILTFHRAYNYGAVLQCYALQCYLRNLGHEVFVIDYRQSWTESLRKVISMGKMKQLSRHPKALFVYLLDSINRQKKMQKSEFIFNSFVDTFLNVQDICFQYKDFPTDYDCYIIGSDQVWGKSCLGGDFDEIYMGRFPHMRQAKVVGYAISSNFESISSMDSKLLTDISERFTALSFREKKISEMIGGATKTYYPTCVDPTLLCNKSVWDKIIDSSWEKKQFILIYEARDSVKHPNLLYRKAYEMQRLAGGNLGIINLSKMEYSVSDFVSAFKYAKCIITTSFHATVFSVIFHRPFYSIMLNDGADGRYVNLLAQLGLSSQCVLPDFYPLIPDVNYSDIDNLLMRYRRQSVDFLNKTLS